MASRYVVPFSSSPFGNRDPFRSLQREIGRMLDDTFRSVGENANALVGAASMPAIDVHESENELCVTADLPGLNEEDIDLRVEGDLLMIRGERKQEQERDERGYHIVERSSGGFQRTVRLPFAPDPAKVDADYANGVLTVRISKQDRQEHSRRIAVRKGGAQGAGQALEQGSGTDTKRAGKMGSAELGLGQDAGETKGASAAQHGQAAKHARSATNDQSEPPRQQAASESRSGQQQGEGGTKGGQRT